MTPRYILIALTFSLLCGPCAPAAQVDPAAQASTLYESGKFHAAAESYRRAVEASEKGLKQDAQRTVHLLLGQGRAQLADGKPKDAEETFRQALNLVAAAHLARATEDEVRAAITQAKAKQGTADQPDIVPPPNSVRPHVVPVPHYNYYNGRTSFFQNYHMNGRDVAECEYLLRCAVAYADSTAGETSIDAVQRRCDLASFYTQQRRYKEAAAVLSKVSDITAKLNADDRLEAQRELLDLASQLAQQRHALEARLIAQPILSSSDAVVDPALVDKVAQIGNSLFAAGDVSGGQDYLKKAIALMEKGSPSDPKILTSRIALAKTYEQQGKFGQALEILELGLSNVGKQVPEPSKMEPVYLSMAIDYDKLGDTAKSKEYALKVAEIWSKHQEGNANDSMQVVDLSIRFAGENDWTTAKALALGVVGAGSAHRPHPMNTYLAPAITKLAKAYDDLGKSDEAVNLYNAFIDERLEMHAAPYELSQLYPEAAIFYIKHGYPDKGYRLVQKLVEAAKTDNNQYSMIIFQLPRICTEFNSAGEHAKALQTAKDIAALKELHDSDFSASLDGCGLVITTAAQVGDKASAKEALMKAATVVSTQLPDSVKFVGPPLKELLDKYGADGDYQRAGNVVSDIARTAQTYKYNPSYASMFVARTAYFLQQDGQSQAASDVFAGALDMEAKTYGPSSLQAAQVMRQYAIALRQIGKGQQAETLEEGANAIQRVYQEHQTRARIAPYKPFAPLSETMKLAETLEDIERSPIRQ